MADFDEPIGQWAKKLLHGELAARDAGCSEVICWSE
jgi:hypothetical protein